MSPEETEQGPSRAKGGAGFLVSLPYLLSVDCVALGVGTYEIFPKMVTFWRNFHNCGYRRCVLTTKGEFDPLQIEVALAQELTVSCLHSFPVFQKSLLISGA